MQEIINIPFWTIYVLVHCGPAFAFMAILTGIFIIATIIGYFASAVEEAGNAEYKQLRIVMRNLFWVAFPVFLVSGFIASLSPTDTEYKAYLGLRAANEVMKSDVGTASQEVIIKWLNAKLDEIGTSSIADKKK